MNTVQGMLKAVVAALIVGLTYASSVISDGITAGEWLQITGAVLVAFNGVYWTPNKDAP